MAIPLLDYPLTSQNARVSNLAGDLHDNGLATIGYSGAGHESYNSEVDGLIQQAYRQIFFHAMRSDRDVFLEITTAQRQHHCAGFHPRAAAVQALSRWLLPVQHQLPHGGSSSRSRAWTPGAWRR